MKEIKVGRLSYREEGPNWNVYYAQNDTMVGAIFLGSLKMSLAKNKKLKKQFMRLMRDAFEEFFLELFGQRPEWRDPVPAPEHERTKE